MDIDLRLESFRKITADERATRINEVRDGNSSFDEFCSENEKASTEKKEQGRLSRSASSGKHILSKAYSSDDYSDVVYVGSGPMKDAMRKRLSRDLPEEDDSAGANDAQKPRSRGVVPGPRAAPAVLHAGMIKWNCHLSKSQMIIPNKTENSLWTLWMTALKNSAN